MENASLINSPAASVTYLCCCVTFPGCQTLMFNDICHFKSRGKIEMISNCFSQCVQCRKGNETFIHWGFFGSLCACETRALALAHECACGQICSPALPHLEGAVSVLGQRKSRVYNLRTVLDSFGTSLHQKTFLQVQNTPQKPGIHTNSELKSRPQSLRASWALNLKYITIHYCLYSRRPRKGSFRKRYL